MPSTSYDHEIYDAAQEVAEALVHIPDLFPERTRELVSAQPPRNFQYLARPSGPSYSRQRFHGAEWEFVFRGEWQGCRALLTFRVDNSLQPKSLRWECACPARARCLHADIVLAYGLRLADDGNLTLDGVTVSSAEPDAPEQPAHLTAENLPELIGPKASHALVFEHPRLALQLVVHEAATSQMPRTGFTPVTVPTARPTKTRKASPTKPIPKLLEGWEIPPDLSAEEPWATAILSLSRRGDAVTPTTRADFNTLARLADAGRLLAPDGRPLQWSLQCEDLFHWKPISPTSVRLERSPPPEWGWVPITNELGYRADTAQLVHIDAPAKLLSTSTPLPPLRLQDQAAVATAWAKNPSLKHLPAPPLLDETSITPRQVTWAVHLTKIQRPDIRFMCDIKVQFRPMVQGKVVSPLPADGDLVARDGGWDCYRVDLEPVREVSHQLRRWGFLPSHSDPQFVLMESICSGDAEELQAAAVTAMLIGDRMPVTCEGLPAVTIYRPGEIARLQLHVEPLPVEGRSDIRLEITATIDDDVVPFDELYKHLRDFSPRKKIQPDATLRQIGANRFALLNDDEVRHFQSTLSPILEMAKLRGKHLHLPCGALLALARDNLPALLASSVYQQAKAKVDALLEAKAAHFAPSKVKGIHGITFPHFQQTAIHWLLTLQKHQLGGLLADDRGFGKTLEVLGAIVTLNQLRQRQGLPPRPSLIVMDRKEIDHWDGHCKKHLRGSKVLWEYGTTRTHDPEILAQHDLVLTTYNLLINEPETFLKADPLFVVLDEARAVKNPTSVRWEVASSFDRASIIPITGTPADRRLDESWPLFELAVPGLLGRQSHFRASIQNLVGRTDSLAQAELSRLQGILTPFILRRLKTDYPDYFPAKHEVPEPITLSDAQAKTYEGARVEHAKQAKAILADMPWHQARVALNAPLQRLRHHCAKIGSKTHSTAKGDHLVSMVADLRASDHRILIFSHFNDVVSTIGERLNSEGFACATWVGGDARQRDKELKLFQQGHMDVLVISQYGASGLNLPEADTVILSDPWVNIQQDEQMGDRAHRFSSKGPVSIYRLFLAGTIEEAAWDVIRRNRVDADALFTDRPGPLQQMDVSREDYDRFFAITPR